MNADYAPRLKPVGVTAENVPSTLTRCDQWVNWQLELSSKGKLTKVPYQSKAPHRNASSTDPATWSSFVEAIAAYEAHATDFAGVGFVLTPETGIVGIDIDHCLDPETGDESPEASEILAALNSYTEVTPSGTGLRIFVLGTLPPGRRKVGDYEMYDRGRFLTVTGARYGEYPHTSTLGPLAFPRGWAA